MIQADDIHRIRNLINSAVIDSEAKGSLRWPLGEEHFRDRLDDVGFCQTKAKIFRNSSMRLKVWDADRFDNSTSAGKLQERPV